MEITRAIARTLGTVYTHRLGEIILLHGVHRWGNDRWSAEAWCCACKRGRACPHPGKHPLIIPRVQEHGSHDGCATRAEAERRWTSLRPRATNLGIVVGPDVFVLDMDPRNGGPTTLAQLELEHGSLPPTLTAHTGGGGAHFWWRVPARSADAARSDGGNDHGDWRASIGPGLDIKAAGGYVVAPPSRHLNGGRRYAWRPGNPTPSQAPAWLWRAARTETTQHPRTNPRSHGGRADPSRLAAWVAEAERGNRNNRLSWALWQTYRAGADDTEIIEAGYGLGLAATEIRRTIRSARNRAR